jgi:hypothetical protein
MIQVPSLHVSRTADLSSLTVAGPAEYVRMNIHKYVNIHLYKHTLTSFYIKTKIYTYVYICIYVLRTADFSCFSVAGPAA